jgi:hypothetical protein
LIRDSGGIVTFRIAISAAGFCETGSGLLAGVSVEAPFCKVDPSGLEISEVVDFFSQAEKPKRKVAAQTEVVSGRDRMVFFMMECVISI